MKKQQFILIAGGVLLLCLVYFFGRTIPPKASSPAPSAKKDSNINTNTILAASKQKLSASQQTYLNQLESAVVRGNVKEQQLNAYRQLANFWKDSAHLLLPYGYYLGQSAKLENSEKNLTFAAHFFLDRLNGQGDPGIKTWMAVQAKELFEKALQINPASDSLKVSLGSCYLFGNIDDNPMQGIQMIKAVADKDPDNMYAEFTLAWGGIISGQLDKAIDRLLNVIDHEPKNEKAVLLLAEAYERKNDKTNAVKWYEAAKKIINNPEFTHEIDQRIEILKK